MKPIRLWLICSGFLKRDTRSTNIREKDGYSCQPAVNMSLRDPVMEPKQNIFLTKCYNRIALMGTLSSKSDNKFGHDYNESSEARISWSRTSHLTGESQDPNSTSLWLSKTFETFTVMRIGFVEITNHRSVIIKHDLNSGCKLLSRTLR